MRQTVVITGAGRDQVGIVARLTTALFELGCNLLDSSMTLLRGEFAIILMTTLSDDLTLDQLRNRLESIQMELGFYLNVRELPHDQFQRAESPEQTCIISVYGADKPGIVSDITTTLANLKANVTDVETSRSGDVFIMILEASLPNSAPLDVIRSALQKSAGRLGVDVTVQELEVVDI